MQKITLLCIGSLKSSDAAMSDCQDYIKRLSRDVSFQIEELPASKLRDPNLQRQEESKRMFDALAKRDGQVWILDELGKEVTSNDFSSKIDALRDTGMPLTFAIGGAYGFDDSVRHRADFILALSKMTLPHDLCRLVFLEQLYRAMQIIKGTGYHH